MKEVTKNIKEEPVSWTAFHPDGHIYSLKNLDGLLASLDKTQQELKQLGWKLQANYKTRD